MLVHLTCLSCRINLAPPHMQIFASFINILIIQKKTSPTKEPYNILISNLNNIGYNLTKKETPLKYKIVKETGETIFDDMGKPVLDNDLDDLYDSLCSFVNDNSILGIKTLNTSSEYDYEYINKGSLTLNILDIKRYLQTYW